MRKYMFLTAVLMAASKVTAAEDNCACFTPTVEQIAAFEERVAELPEPIYRYARYYAGWLLPPETVNGQTVMRRRIQGQFVPLKASEASAVHIVEGRRLPPLRGEGCIANVDIPPQNDAFLLFPRCNRPGGWTPGAAEIADLERRVVLPQGARPLDRYARHYAGVTDSGVRLIRAVFLDFAEGTPGINVESEIELPLIVEDGCAAIDVEYNPETKLSSVRCHRIN